jgi:hypothetical protein
VVRQIRGNRSRLLTSSASHGRVRIMTRSRPSSGRRIYPDVCFGLLLRWMVGSGVRNRPWRFDTAVDSKTPRVFGPRIASTRERIRVLERAPHPTGASSIAEPVGPPTRLGISAERESRSARHEHHGRGLARRKASRRGTKTQVADRRRSSSTLLPSADAELRRSHRPSASRPVVVCTVRPKLAFRSREVAPRFVVPAFRGFGVGTLAAATRSRSEIERQRFVGRWSPCLNERFATSARPPRRDAQLWWPAPAKPGMLQFCTVKRLLRRNTAHKRYSPAPGPPVLTTACFAP